MKSRGCPWFPFVLELLRESKEGYRGVPMARRICLFPTSDEPGRREVLKSKKAESRCSMTHHQLARRLARSRVGQSQRASALRPYRALEIKQSFPPRSIWPSVHRAPRPGRPHGRVKRSSSAFGSLTQADGCQPASAQSSPLTAELQIMK